MSEISAGYFALGDQQLEYARIAQRRAGPSLVLLHEGLGCVAMWKGFPQALAAISGFEVLSYSRAGYGASSPVALPRPIDFHRREALEVLPAVLDAAAIKTCILIGHSDGASIALNYCGEVADPRVRAVVAMAPHILTEDKCVASVREAIAAYAAGELRTALARYHGDNVECAFRGWSETWTDVRFRAWSIEAGLGGITVPVLSVRGEDDPYNTPVHVERIAERVSGPVERLDVAGCGHAPHAECSALVLERVARFVCAVDPQATSE